jgi:steroid delta-isomerase-like uncharacterized protein
MFSHIKTISIAGVVFIALSSIFQIDAAASEAEMRTAMQGMLDALNADDAAEMSSYWTDDIVYDFVPQPPSLNGKQEVAAFWEGLFQGVPDFHRTQNRILVSGNIMVTEAIATGTHLGELSGIPATGSSLHLAPLSIWEFEGDKIKRATEYVDLATMLTQMGLMPAPDLDPALLVPSFPVPDAEPTGLTPLEAAAEFTSRWNAGDLSGMAKMIQPDADILIAPLGVPLSRDAYLAVGEMMFQGFSEMPMEIVRAIDMGDGWVVSELLIKGTNDGPYMGMPATRRSIQLRGVSLQRYNAEGLITDLSSYYDNLTMLAQLGLFPPPDLETNKALERRVFDEIWNQGLLDVADEVFAPDAILHLGTDDVQGPEGFKEYVAGYREAFPDIHWAVEDQVAEGDMVVTRLTGTGTHQGELMGIPPTGLQVTVTAIANVRIVGDKIQESWSSWDALGLMQQLGVMPPTATDYTWGPPSEVTGDLGDPVTNTAMVLYFVQKFWNEQNVAGLDNTHSPDLIAHNPVIPGNPLPYNMYKQVGLLHLAAFPDMRVTAENVVAEGDKVAVRWTVNGTHLGALMGVPPTGRSVTFDGTTLYRFADGKIIENWWAYDALGMMQQITAPPEP